jgi:dihydroorotate dehydrogenase (NAD+) catalytic subunit
MLDLNGIKLRNRLLTSATFLGYGARPRGAFFVYGMSPFAPLLDLSRFGAITTRTLTLEPREGHFTLKQRWSPAEWPELFRGYRGVLRAIDGGWMNAFGWCNVGLREYFKEYYPRTHHLNRVISVGGFSADDFCALVAAVNEHTAPGDVAAIEFNVSCHNVNFDFPSIVEEVLANAVPRSKHPVILKVSPDDDYCQIARIAEQHGVAAITAINTVKGLRLDPRTGRPWMKNGYGGMSGRCIKPIGLRVVAELSEVVNLPIIATAGIRDYDDCREFFWAGAQAVSLGSEAFLPRPANVVLAPLKALQIRRLIKQIEDCDIPDRRRQRRAKHLTEAVLAER